MSRPFHLLTKPIGPICNLDCSYCFYLEKEPLYREPGARYSFRMTDEVLERYVREYIEAQPSGLPEIQFAWQGGEPTLMGLPFFERVVELQKKHGRPGQRIHNALQTNATLLDDDWAHFLKQHRFLVGVSIDGPARLHDAHRPDRDGAGSFAPVMAGVELLARHGVEFNTLTVVHRDNSRHPVEIYDFLKQAGSTFLQFIPLVEHSGGLEAKRLRRELGPTRRYRGAEVGARSVEPRAWGEFMSGVFERWLECDDVGKIFVQTFDTLLAIELGHPSPLCIHARECGDALAIEHNGDVYSCDHFVSPEYKLGNVMDEGLETMVDSEAQRRFGRDKSEHLPRYCQRCPYLELCYGVCPKDRILETPDGEPGLAYLCEGYKLFFKDCVPVLRDMAECVRMGHAASDHARLDVLRASAALSQGASRETRISRNAPCPCGSGRKFKRCCGESGRVPNAGRPQLSRVRRTPASARTLGDFTHNRR